MAALVAEGREAQQHRNGRELAIFEHDFDRVAIFVDALLEGNDRQTAARLADVAESGIRAWMKAADDGDTRYRTIAALIRAAEAVAESDTVRYIRAAGKDPRFSAAGYDLARAQESRPLGPAHRREQYAPRGRADWGPRQRSASLP